MKRLLPGILLAGALASVPCARGAGMATNRWVRAAGKDARASVAENWSLGHAPKRNEVALFTARHPTAAVWDAAAGRYALAALPADAAVTPGFGGIPEPVGTRRVDPTTVDLFVLPGLLFDRLGTRLGHGRGHLDRLLAARRPGAAVLGLAFPWQIADAPIPREAHDVPMDAVLLP